MELLQRLIRFDTTNPPGNERECVAYISNLFAEAGCDCTIVGSSADRPNLITRLKGQSNAPPLLLYGHVDVVTTAGQTWQHPPFEGRLVDGYVWGRGALDMKSGIVMMLSAFLRAKAEDLHLAGDVILALVSDEEGGGDAGAKYLVENQSGLFQGGDTPSASSGIQLRGRAAEVLSHHGGRKTDLPSSSNDQRSGRARFIAPTGRGNGPYGLFLT